MRVLQVHPWRLSLWGVPALGYVLLMCSHAEFKTWQPAELGMKLWSDKTIELLVIIGWACAMRCVISPVCGAASAFNLGTSFLEAYGSG